MTLPANATTQFRALVDQSVARAPLVSPTAAFTYFASISKAKSSTDLGDDLYRTIFGKLKSTSSGRITPAEVRRLQRTLRYETLLGSTKEPYYSVARIVHDAGDRTTGYLPFANAAEWLDAIDAARGCLVVSGPLFDHSPRVDAVIAAADYLQKAGVPIAVKDGRFDIDDKSVVDWCRQIEGDIANLGGWAVLNQAFAYLRQNHYAIGRFVPGRNPANSARPPSCPINYIINLAVKNIASRPITDEATGAPLWKSIVERSRNLCAVLDVEPYSNMEDIVLPPEQVPEYVATAALFDHIFTLRQWIPSQTTAILEGIFDFVDAKQMKASLGWTVVDAIQLAQFAFTDVADKDLTTLAVDKVADCGVGRNTWVQMRPHFVHSLSSLNRDYATPRDADKANLGAKPFVEMPNKQFLGVISPSLSAPAFFEAVSCALRDSRYPNLDGEMGLAMERLLARALRDHGLAVSVESGKYKLFDPLENKLVDGECDVVVEMDDRVIFFEMKKKPLTRVASTGDDLAGLVDLSSSLMDAQAQLVRHERILRHNKSITFENGFVLQHKGREVEQIAVTLLDFGSFQDRFLLGQLLAALIGRTMASHSPIASQQKALQKLNRSIQNLTKQMALPAGSVVDPIKLFRNYWFLSIPQILMMLDGVEHAQTLAKRLDTMRVITYRTLDFYRDYAFALQQKLVK